MDLPVYNILFNRMKAGERGLPSPNPAPVPQAPDFSGMLSGSPTPSYGPTGIEQTLSSPLAQAGLALLGSNPQGSTPNALSLAVNEALKTMRARRHRTETMDWQHSLQQAYPDGNVPLPVIQSALQEGIATGNPYLTYAAKSFLTTRMDEAKLAASMTPKGTTVYDRAGNASRVYDTPNGPIIVPITEANGQQFSRGPAQSIVAPTDVGWHPTANGKQEVYGGYQIDATGKGSFVPLPAPGGGAQVRAVSATGGQKPSLPQQEAAATFAADMDTIHRTLGGAFGSGSLTDRLRAAGAGENNRSLRMLLGSSDYKDYNVARQRAAEKLAALSAGRKSNYLIKLIKESYFPSYTGDPSTWKEQMARLDLTNQMLQILYNPDVPDATKQKIRTEVRQMVVSSLPGSAPESEISQYLGTNAQATGTSLDVNKFDSVVGGGP